MVKRWIMVLAAVLMMPVVGIAQEGNASAAESEARAVAAPWLEVLDEGSYEQSWAQAAVIFQEGITQLQWADRIGQTRQATGSTVVRTFNRAQYATDLPNAPPGEYVLVEYITEFQNVGIAEEAVIVRRESDGAWRVAGAFVRPAEYR